MVDYLYRFQTLCLPDIYPWSLATEKLAVSNRKKFLGKSWSESPSILSSTLGCLTNLKIKIFLMKELQEPIFEPLNIGEVRRIDKSFLFTGYSMIHSFHSSMLWNQINLSQLLLLWAYMLAWLRFGYVSSRGVIAYNTSHHYIYISMSYWY